MSLSLSLVEEGEIKDADADHGRRVLQRDDSEGVEHPDNLPLQIQVTSVLLQLFHLRLEALHWRLERMVAIIMVITNCTPNTAITKP